MEMPLRPAVLLDRDGVINQDNSNFVRTPDALIPLPGSLDAIRRLKEAGWLVAVCTNQSGVGRGLYSLNDLQAIHGRLRQLLAEHDTSVDGIYACPHHPDDGCDCRKPKPGLLLRAARELPIDLAASFMVGDAGRDLEAGIRAGCSPVLVLTGKGRQTRQEPVAASIPSYDCLADFVDSLLQGQL